MGVIGFIGEPILMVINSSGGKLFGGFAIHDVMRGITSSVHTLCVGRCQSMATVLLAAGAEGHCSVLRSARVMIHPTTTNLGGDQRSALLEVEAAEAAQSDKRMIAALSKLSHKPGRDPPCLHAYDLLRCTSRGGLRIG